MMKVTKNLISILMFLMCSVVVSAQESVSVQGKVYEGNLQGLVTLTFDFKSDGNAVFTAEAFGEKESKNVTYEQDGSKITVHAQNGDMVLTQDGDNTLSLDIDGSTVHLTCQTPNIGEAKIMYVSGRTFSGTFGNGGRLTLTFKTSREVNVSISTGYQEQEEVWSYRKHGDSIIMTEPMGREITLKLNEKNELKGMFTVVNVTLRLVK